MSTDVTRRLFLTAGLASGAVFFVGCGEENAAPPKVPESTPPSKTGGPTATRALEPNAWVRIAPSGAVTVVVDKSEMGQGVETSLPMIVADELDADWSKVKIEFAPVGDAYKNPLFGMQGTGGSTSIRGMWMPLRNAGAAAREMLIAAAASTWGIDPGQCRAEKGAIVNAKGERLEFGSLTTKAAAMAVPKEPKLKKLSELKLVGTRVVRLDQPLKASGQVEFAIDVKRPGMLTAVLARCPVFGGKVGPFDEAAAMKVKGVKKVIVTPNGVAVVADHFWAAKKGAEALAVKWDEGANAKVSTATLRDDATKLTKKPGVEVETKGDAAKALKDAHKKIEAVYEVPFQAHATMEPQTCVAEVRSDGCDLWVGTQFQEVTRGVTAKITGLAPETVAVHTTYLGGGFGRRSEMDFVIDAVSIAKEMRGTPIKVIWTREDDLRHDFYRPMAVGALAGGVDKSGKIVAWTHRVVSSSIMARVFPQFVKNGIDDTCVEGATKLPYAIDNVHVDLHTWNQPVPVGFWRSVGNSQNAFIKECFFDELCALTKQDPLTARRAAMTDPRLKGVLELAASKAGWDKPLEKGRGRGIAAHESFGSWVAQVAEVTVQGGKVKVDRVVCAIDCGIVVNPDTVEAQVQSAIVYGLTAALKSEITIEGGKVVQGNFHNFKLLRIDEMPVVEVFIVPSSENPGGVGEPATPPIAPAVANAIFAATGRRIRRLPVTSADLKGA